MPVTLSDNLETLEHLANNHPWLDIGTAKYSVELHGNGYALYYGRSDTAHGFRLCNLTDLDPKRPDLPDLIEKALNRFVGQ